MYLLEFSWKKSKTKNNEPNNFENNKKVVFYFYILFWKFKDVLFLWNFKLFIIFFL